MTVAELTRRFKSIDLMDEVEKSVQQTSYDIEALNKEQLYSGFRSDGERIGKYNSITYAIDKENKNPKPGFMNADLFYTGAFYKGFNVLVKNGYFEVNSSDEKEPDLIEDYTEKIFGLNDKNTGEYSTGTFFKALKSRILQKLGK